MRVAATPGPASKRTNQTRQRSLGEHGLLDVAPRVTLPATSSRAALEGRWQWPRLRLGIERAHD